MNPRFDLAQRHLKFALTWTPGLCVFVTLAFWSTDGGDFWAQLVMALIIAQTSSLVCSLGALLIDRLQRRLYLWRGWVYPPASALAYLLRAAPFLAPGLWLGFQVMGLSAPHLGLVWRTPGISSWRNGLVFGGMASGFLSLLNLRREGQVAQGLAQARIRQLENANLRAQLAALTAQMNPHLLFNALNSIATLIESEPAQAEAMTFGLADLYRRLLAAAGSQTHPLSEELALVEAYLDVERGRFGANCLEFTLTIEATAEAHAKAAFVPVLCLQPFVENAVKHGFLSRNEGGHIWIRVAMELSGDLRIEVEDDGVGLGHSHHTSGSGTALRNCRERFQLLYGDKAVVELVTGQKAGAGRGTLVRLNIPSTADTTSAGRA